VDESTRGGLPNTRHLGNKEEEIKMYIHNSHQNIPRRKKCLRKRIDLELTEIAKICFMLILILAFAGLSFADSDTNVSNTVDEMIRSQFQRVHSDDVFVEIRMKDGRTIFGRVIEYVPNEMLKVQVRGDVVLYIQVEEVKEVLSVKRSQVPEAVRKSGPITLLHKGVKLGINWERSINLGESK